MQLMDPERWSKLVDLFNRAREGTPAERAALLQEVGQTDPSLLQDLMEMLADDISGDDPLPHGVLPAQGEALPGPQQDRWIGKYRIVSRLGAGGMGVIYKAEDPRLKRTVAIKLVLAHPLSDGAAAERLIREARAAAALLHPNICPVYEINESDGFPYIVMAALEGENLAQYLFGGRRLPLADALPIALQIAEGLQAAHEKGIIHRDVKPANIFITPLTRGGVHVTLLDFGLAQTHDHSRLTRDGAVAGTVAYMSPEQIGGIALDARTDVWSLGVILYELLTGVRPFGSGPDSATLHAIQNTAPVPPSSHSPGLPPVVDAIVAKALAKNREDRYPTAAALAADLESLVPSKTGHSGGTANLGLSRRQLSPASLGLALALIALAAAAVASWYYKRPVPTVSQLAFRQVTETVPENRVTTATLSPDGQYVAYASIQGAIHLKELTTGINQPLATIPGQIFTHISWSGDGTLLLLSGHARAEARAGLWLITRSGAVRRLTDNAKEGTLSPDGGSIAYLNAEGSQVWTWKLADSAPRLIVTDSNRESFLFTLWLDAGKTISFAQLDGVSASATAAQPKVYHPNNFLWKFRIVDVASRQIRATHDGVRMLYPTALTGNRIAYLTWTPEIASRYSLEEVELNPETLAFRKVRSLPLTSAYISVSTSGSGDRVAVVRTEWQDEILVTTFDSNTQSIGKLQRLTFDSRNDYPHSWTADGRHILFESERSGKYTLYQQSSLGGDPVPLIQNPSRDVFPQLTPDGRWILYLSKNERPDPWFIHRIPVTGGKGEPVPNVGPADEFRCPAPNVAASPPPSCVLRTVADGQFLFHELDPLTGKGRELTRAVWTRPVFGDWSLAADGSLAAIPEHEQLRPTIRIVDLHHPGRRDRELVLAGNFSLSGVQWAPSGLGWFVAVPRALNKPALSTETNTELRYIDLQGRSKVLLRTSGNTFAVPSPDGTRFAFIDRFGSSNVWLATQP